MLRTIKRKLLFVVLSALFVFSAAMFTVLNTKTANAADFTITNIETTSVDGTCYQFKITPSGYSVSDGYDHLNINVNVPDKIEINGKTVTEWNTEYKDIAANWSFSTYPSNNSSYAGGYYYKLPVFIRGYKNLMRLYIHQNLYSIIVAEYGLMDIQVKAGLTAEGNTLSADSGIYVVKDSSGAAGTTVAFSNSYIKQGAYSTHELVRSIMKYMLLTLNVMD